MPRDRQTTNLNQSKIDYKEENDVQYHFNRDSEEENYIRNFRNSSFFKEDYSKSNMLLLTKIT